MEHDNSLTMNMAVEIRSSCPQSTDFSAFSGSPASRSLHPNGVSSQDGLSPAMGDRANRLHAAPAHVSETVVVCGEQQ